MGFHMTDMRVKFFGIHDGATCPQVDTAKEILQEYSTGRKIQDLYDAIELHNVLEFEDHNLLSDSFSEEGPQEQIQSIPSLKKELAAYFSCLDVSEIQDNFSGIDYYYYSDDLIHLLTRHNVDKTIGAEPLVDALEHAQIPLS